MKSWKRRIRGKRLSITPVNYYPCNVIGRWFTELEISQYYKSKPDRSTVNDEVIQKLAKQLNDLNDIEFLRDNEYFSHQPLYIGYRAYNLVWDYDESLFTANLLIIDCYRELALDK